MRFILLVLILVAGISAQAENLQIDRLNLIISRLDQLRAEMNLKLRRNRDTTETVEKAVQMKMLVQEMLLNNLSSASTEVLPALPVLVKTQIYPFLPSFSTSDFPLLKHSYQVGYALRSHQGVFVVTSQHPDHLYKDIPSDFYLARASDLVFLYPFAVKSSPKRFLVNEDLIAPDFFVSDGTLGLSGHHVVIEHGFSRQLLLIPEILSYLPVPTPQPPLQVVLMGGPRWIFGQVVESFASQSGLLWRLQGKNFDFWRELPDENAHFSQNVYVILNSDREGQEIYWPKSLVDQVSFGYRSGKIRHVLALANHPEKQYAFTTEGLLIPLDQTKSELSQKDKWVSWTSQVCERWLSRP